MNQFTRILNQLNQDISDDSDDGGQMFPGCPWPRNPCTHAFNAPSRTLVRWWLAQARRRMKLRAVVAQLIEKARGTQCELCLSRRQLSVECIVPLEVLAERFDNEHGDDEEFDNVQWKTFWVKHQRYRTVCLQCTTSTKEQERAEALRGSIKADVDDGGDEYPEWGAVYLTAASRAILIGWYKQAQERVFGRGGKRRRRVALDVSDDEGEEPTHAWAKRPVVLKAASHALAVRWLRTARARMQARAGKDADELAIQKQKKARYVPAPIVPAQPPALRPPP